MKLRPDVRIVPIRGNMDTRIRKLHHPREDEPKLDGIVVALAGIKRLDLTEYISHIFDVDEMIPAPGQGMLGIEMVADNSALLDKVESLADFTTENIRRMERGFMRAMGGDCHMPLGAHAFCKDDTYYLKALYGNADGSRIAVAEAFGEDQDIVTKKVIVEIQKQFCREVT